MQHEGEHENCIRILAGKPEGMRELERLSRRWKDNIEVNIKVLACGLEPYRSDMNHIAQM
jgi:hypothetical protein